MPASPVMRGLASEVLLADPQRVPEARFVALAQLWQRRIMAVLLSRYRWVGLPEGVDQYWLEHTLCSQGLVAVYRPDFVDRPVWTTASVQQLTRLGRPATYRLDRLDGGSVVLDAQAVVPIWCASDHAPVLDVVALYAERLAHIDISLDGLVVASRHPVVLVGDETAQLTLAQFWRQLQAGQPAIWTHSAFGRSIREQVQAFDLGIRPDSIASLQEAKRDLLAELLPLLGVRVQPGEKRERLVASEARAAADETAVLRAAGYDTRLEACGEIRRRWGVPVMIEWAGAAEERQSL